MTSIQSQSNCSTEMKFPLIADPETMQIPQGANCIVCGAAVGEHLGFVRLTFGGMLYHDKKRRSGGPSDRMDSVFSLWHHGPHPSKENKDGTIELTSMDNAEHRMEIVTPTKGGQADILFCTSNCLRSFFASAVEGFEEGITKAEREFEQRKVEQAD
jgi:hypothetical protein